MQRRAAPAACVPLSIATQRRVACRVPEGTQAEAIFVAKADGVLAGLAVVDQARRRGLRPQLITNNAGAWSCLAKMGSESYCSICHVFRLALP